MSALRFFAFLFVPFAAIAQPNFVARGEHQLGANVGAGFADDFSTVSYGGGIVLGGMVGLDVSSSSLASADDPGVTSVDGLNFGATLLLLRGERSHTYLALQYSYSSADVVYSAPMRSGQIWGTTHAAGLAFGAAAQRDRRIQALPSASIHYVSTKAASVKDAGVMVAGELPVLIRVSDAWRLILNGGVAHYNEELSFAAGLRLVFVWGTPAPSGP